MKKNTAIRPFYEVTHEYQESLKELLGASMLLREAVGTVLRLNDQGADPSKAIASLKEYHERAERAAHGPCN